MGDDDYGFVERRAQPDPIHIIVINRLDQLEKSNSETRASIEGKIDSKFGEVAERVTVLETKVNGVQSWIDHRQFTDDLQHARMQRVKMTLSSARSWVTFAVGTAAGAAALHLHLL